MWVKVNGLKNNAALNGAIGVVVGRPVHEGRLPVSAKGRVIAIRPANIKPTNDLPRAHAGEVQWPAVSHQVDETVGYMLQLWPWRVSGQSRIQR